MSLWTPGGEHPVDGPGSQGPGPGPSAEPEGFDPYDELQDLSPEDRARAEQMLNEMAEVREQLAQTPAAVVIANHAMGLYELAAIHLSQQPPNLGEARLAIDSFSSLVGVLTGQLGPDEQTLQDGLAQLRMAFVQLSAGAGPDAGSGEEPAEQ